MNATVIFTDSPIVFTARPRRPEWVVYTDRQTDLSDVWVEECDPQNEQGALVTGFYTARAVPALDKRHNACEVTTFDLDGIAVETPDGTTYYDRAWLVQAWGMDAIWRVESVEMEDLG